MSSVLGNTQANGTFAISNVSGDHWKTTQFVRIREQGGDVWSCGQAKPVAVDPTDANIIFARFVSEGEVHAVVLVEQLASNRARLSVAVGDVNGDGAVSGTDLAVRGSPKACGTSQGTVSFAYVLKDVLISSFKSTTVDITPSELDGLRSIRIRKLTGNGGQDWFPECRSSFLTALLLP